jgi:5-methyltetrahydropteroyltriglutamate--homocysteine methyltransferase
MKRSTDRILTTHTGSLPRTRKVVELLLAEQHNRGARKVELAAAVGEAIAHVVEKQIECGIDVINDGEQGRTDYTVHVLDRLAGFAGESTPPLGTGDAEFPELAQLLKQFASPFQYRPACTGEVTWKDFAAAQADIELAKRAMSGANAVECFMTSPSPGQIARFLKNRHYRSEEAYVYALADVMKREYQAIVDAGFILQLDCPDLAMLRHTVHLDKSLADFRKIIAVNVAALNHAVADIPAERMRMHVCWGSTVAPHHTDVPLIDIIDIVLSAKPMAVSFPAANGRHEHEWKIWREVKLPPGKVIVPGVIDSTVNTVEHPGTRRRPHREFCRRGRARERDRRRRLRLRDLRRPGSGRQQDRLAQAAIAC